jgi:hypothetical protein
VKNVRIVIYTRCGTDIIKVRHFELPELNIGDKAMTYLGDPPTMADAFVIRQSKVVALANAQRIVEVWEKPDAAAEEVASLIGTTMMGRTYVMEDAS